MRKNLSSAITAFLLSAVLLLSSAPFASTRVEAARKTYTKTSLPSLKISGKNLVSRKTGKKVQLRGVSTHGINWYKNINEYQEMPAYLNQDFMYELKDKWGANAIRLAMYVEEYNGYMSGGNNAKGDQAKMQKLLKSTLSNAVDEATKAGLYVIIDWHVLNIDPGKYTSQAVSFFKWASKKYAKNTNVLYEICNEPSSGTWPSIKKYAGKVIPAIRKNSKNAVVIVGTPTWSQDVDIAAKSKLTQKNVMYTLHFYAATHGQSYMNKLKTALSSKLPVFVTEFGICEASGDGRIDTKTANQWIKLLNKNKISYMMWSVSNKPEAASIFKSNVTKTKGFKTSDMTESGKWIYKLLRKSK